MRHRSGNTPCPPAPARRRAVRRRFRTHMSIGRRRRVGTRRPFRFGVALLDARIVLRLTLIGATVAAIAFAVALLAWRIAQDLRIP